MLMFSYALDTVGVLPVFADCDDIEVELSNCSLD